MQFLRTRWLAATVTLVVVVAGFFAIQLAAGGSGNGDRAFRLAPAPERTNPPRGPGLRGIELDGIPRDFPRSRIREVARTALEIAGGGFVAEIEKSDDPGEAWEVEVEGPNGEIDIALDEKLARVPNVPFGG